MSTPIINRPQGLVSLLGLRDMGGVPREFADVVAPTVDLTDLFLVDRTTVNAQQTFTTATTWNAITVPPGELWRVHQWGFRGGPLLAGERIGVGLYIGDPFVTPITGAFRANHTGEFVIGAASSMFWAKAGAVLGVYCTDIVTAGSIGIETTVYVTRLRV